jgi:hypothetical protein
MGLGEIWWSTTVWEPPDAPVQPVGVPAGARKYECRSLSLRNFPAIELPVEKLLGVFEAASVMAKGQMIVGGPSAWISRFWAPGTRVVLGLPQREEHRVL